MKGSLEQQGAGLQDPAVRDDVVRVAGHVEHLHLRARPRAALRQLAAAHPRHHDVGEEQVDGAGVLGRTSSMRLAGARASSTW